MQNTQNASVLLIFLGGPMGPIRLVWDGGAMLLEGFGGTLPPKDDAPAE